MKMYFKLISLAFCLSATPIIADNLPSSDKPSWISYHAVHEGSKHTVGVSMDGSLDLFFMKRDEKINKSWPITLKVKVERKAKTKGAKWSTKKVNKNGFSNVKKQEENPDTLVLEGMVTGDIKFKLSYEFTKDGVKLDAELQGEAKDADEAEYRLVLESKIDELYKIKDDDDEKSIKKKTRGQEAVLQTRNARSTRIKFYEKVDAGQLIKDEVTEVTLRAEKIGRKKLTWKLANPKSGSLLLQPRSDDGDICGGFTITTALTDDTGKKTGDGLWLIYK